jgi:hypothetical protein
MPWAKHRIVPSQKKRSINGFDDRPECHPGGAAGPIAGSRCQLPLPPEPPPLPKKERAFFLNKKKQKDFSN